MKEFLDGVVEGFWEGVRDMAPFLVLIYVIAWIVRAL